jgi:hypothetical protein
MYEQTKKQIISKPYGAFYFANKWTKKYIIIIMSQKKKAPEGARKHL